MSREQQIEEMAKDVWKASCAGNNLKCNTCEHSGLLNNEYSCLDYVIAEGLYNADYRKQSELTPCDYCRFNPPSSGDGKPCSVCPAQAKGGE